VYSGSTPGTLVWFSRAGAAPLIWLALSGLCSVLLALIARWGETVGQDRIAVMAWNYAIASAITVGMAWGPGLVQPTQFTWLVGSIAGLSYAAALLFWMIAIPRVGLGISTTSMRLAIVWPALVAILFFGESPTLLQWLGIALALGSVGLLLLSGGGLSVRMSAGTVGWLVVLWASAGLNAALLKVFTAGSAPAERPVFLALIFVIAGVVCWGIVAGRRLRQPAHTLDRGDLLRGLLFGAINVASNVSLLRALEELPAVVVFPMRDAGIIAAVSLTGVLFLRERPSRWGYAAIVAAVAAVVLIAL
jgi:drug/metabolite transporter (DMT)-like permease